jgi:hypothetical protein
MRMNRQDAEVAKKVGWREPGAALATQLRLGLLINFNVTTLRSGIKRVVHTPQEFGDLCVFAVNPR